MNTKIGNHTIAFLDILGFKSILKEYLLENIGNAYCNALEIVPEVAGNDGQYHGFKDSIASSYAFSDSIIIWSKDETEHGCWSVINYVKRAMQIFIRVGMSVRGAITFGEMFIDETKNIFLGDPIIKATDLEKQQEWIGVAIDSSVEKKFPRFFKDRIKEIKAGSRFIKYYSYPEVMRYPVPFKCGHSQMLYAINWLDMRNIELIDDFSKLAQNPKVPDKDKLKYKNTFDYIHYINSVIERMPNDPGNTITYHTENDLYTEILS